jgi:hypothetical protein
LNALNDAYAAGLIDGEGCIGIQESAGQRVYSVRVDVGMTTKAMSVLTRLHRQYGGTLRRNRAQTDRWDAAEMWSVFGFAAAALLRRVEPYLILKAEQAQIALRVEDIRLSLPKTPTGRSRWSDDARARCERLKRRMHELNRKGPSIEPLEGRSPFARLVAGEWVTDQTDLFSDLGWEPFSGPWPSSGFMRDGRAYARPTWAPPTSATVSSSLPSVPLLPTPVASPYGSNQFPSQHAAVRPSLEAIAKALTD